MSTTEITAAVELLASEGYNRTDIATAIDSMIANTNLDSPQPDEGYVFTEAEVQVLRDQLNS